MLDALRNAWKIPDLRKRIKYTALMLILFRIGTFVPVPRMDPNAVRAMIEKGIKFETYAYARIKGSIIDELRKIDWVPQGIRKKVKTLQKAFSELEQLLARSVDDKDICNYLNITLKELHEIYTEMATFYGILPFEDLLGHEDTGQSSNQPDVQAEKKEVKEILGNAINKLPSQEKVVITLYYYEGLNFKEIAEVLELSQGRISQLHTKAILRLRGHLSRKRASL
jgi:RNA polymerase sigma factor for flagellar operon FliA